MWKVVALEAAVRSMDPHWQGVRWLILGVWHNAQFRMGGGGGAGGSEMGLEAPGLGVGGSMIWELIQRGAVVNLVWISSLSENGTIPAAELAEIKLFEEPLWRPGQKMFCMRGEI